MTELDVLAEDLGISGRTLRRAAGRGLIRCQRTSPYKPTINGRERRYVRSHWPMLQRLVTALRTEHAVRLAVLFGSAARGEMHSASDVDLLLDLVDGAPPLAVARLGSKLERLLGRPVQIVTLTDAERSPLLLADVLHDGRVLIDRDGRWSKLSRRVARIQKAAAEQDAALEQAAWAALDQLAVRVADMPRHYEVYAVEHGFELLVNSISQLVRETLEQHGLREPDDSQNAPADLRAFCEAGAITKAQRDRMISLCRLRNELQHEYPDVRASSIHEGVKVLLAEIGPFMQSYSAWLKRETL